MCNVSKIHAKYMPEIVDNIQYVKIKSKLSIFFTENSK